MNNIFQARKELKIGKIIEVSGNSLRIEIDDAVNELIRAVDGQVYSFGQMGSIIKIHFGKKLLFAFVRLLRMRSEIIADDESQQINTSDDARILEADLFGQGNWNSGLNRLEFHRGVETYPLPLQSAYICLNDELEAVYQAAENNAQDEVISPMVPIGNYIGGNNAVCRANIDKLFGQHFAILGSTGSGKSGTVASILHSVLEHKPNDDVLEPRIVMIDPHGEYGSAFGERARVYKAYNDASLTNENTEILKLPYWLMSSDELRSLIIGKTEFEATSQNNIIYEAITYARQFQAGVIKKIGDNPVGSQPAEPAEGKSEEDVLNFDRDKPLPFMLSDFLFHVKQVQGKRAGTSTEFPPSSSERQRIESIIKKLRVLRANPQLDFLMKEYDESTSPTLNNVLNQFIGERKGKDICIIDISGLPNEVAGPLTALISSTLYILNIRI